MKNCSNSSPGKFKIKKTESYVEEADPFSLADDYEVNIADEEETKLNQRISESQLPVFINDTSENRSIIQIKFDYVDSSDQSSNFIKNSESQ